jgi:hypothetical protein
MHAYHRRGVKEPLEQWLALNLGENLLAPPSTSSVSGGESSSGSGESGATYGATYSSYTYRNNYPGASTSSGNSGGSSNSSSSSNGTSNSSNTGGSGNSSNSGSSSPGGSSDSQQGGGLTPHGMLRKVLRDSHVATTLEFDTVAECLAAELKRRITSRRPMLRERYVCVTWRGTHTKMSTMSRSVVGAVQEVESSFTHSLKPPGFNPCAYEVKH